MAHNSITSIYLVIVPSKYRYVCTSNCRVLLLLLLLNTLITIVN